jgi:hypothetical protein
MTRQEIKAALKTRGIFDTNSKDQLWQQAFQLYYQETKQKLSISCGSCFNRVRNWLQA